MNPELRIGLLEKLGSYMRGDDPAWAEAKMRAGAVNNWFVPEFVDRASLSIANNYLIAEELSVFADTYPIARETTQKLVGLVLAGNIPLVGFHDLLCTFLSGHRSLVKLSTKDEVLLKHIVEKMISWEPEIADVIRFADQLKSCDAYIATGSNNTSRYFDYYFSKYPHIIRKNRTSVAILDGTESTEDLEKLSDSVNLYFGLGCRSVTKLFVPSSYDFVPLLNAFNKYQYFAEHNKYRNNFDYQYAILLLDHQYYMTNGSVLLSEKESIFSPISQLHYSFYTDLVKLKTDLVQRQDVQCIAGDGFLDFGALQDPRLGDFADNVDTMLFLTSL